MIPPDSYQSVDESHHNDNQRRFIQIEQKLDRNTVVTEKLALDTADLLEMWKDAAVFFKWMRKGGSAVIWMSKVAAGIAGAWALWKYGGPK